MTRISILTFDGFNEIDSFVALNILNRVGGDVLNAEIASPTASVVSMNGVRIEAQQDLQSLGDADVVIVGSGGNSAEIARDQALLNQLNFDPERQLLCSQCSGALILAGLGLLDGKEISADKSSRAKLTEAGYLLSACALSRHGNIVTAGGCLSAHYLAALIICQLAGRESMQEALGYVTPVGEEEQYLARVKTVVLPHVYEIDASTGR